MDKVTAAKQEAREALRAIVKPGDTVYTVLRHVSRSGMQRRIDMFVMQQDGQPRWISNLANRAMDGRNLTDDKGIKANGCGMDMGFNLVYNLGWCLFGKTWMCTGKGCPSNEHSNGDRNYEPHTHNDGGYALKQQWL